MPGSHVSPGMKELFQAIYIYLLLTSSHFINRFLLICVSPHGLCLHVIAMMLCPQKLHDIFLCHLSELLFQAFS